MGYREVTMVEVKEVLRQWLAGRGRRAIARWVGVDRNTVRRYVLTGERCGLVKGGGVAALTDDRLGQVVAKLRGGAERSMGEGWGSCEKHRATIAGLIERRLRLTKVRKLLLRQGIQVSYATLYRFAVSELGFGRCGPTIPVADCAPGEELQVDTGWMGSMEPDDTGRRRKFRAWIFTSVCTRHRFVYPTFGEKTVDAIEACEAAWAFFGGIFRVMIPDNTKAIVQRADPLEPLFNRTFLEYSQVRDFLIDPTRVRSPKDKARVERAVPTVRDDCFGGEVLRTLEEARHHARQWCLEDYGRRRHTRTQRLPLEHFEAEERSCLKPAPAEPYDIPLWCDPLVARDQHAAVAKALYSLPRRYIGEKLQARADRAIVRFYEGATIIKTHPRQPAGGRSTDPTDFPPERAACALRDIAFFERQAREHGEAVGRFAHAVLSGPLPWTRMRSVYALLNLCRRYGDTRVADACIRAHDADMLSVRRLGRMLEQGAVHTSSEPSAKVISLSRYLRPNSQYALPLATRGPECPNGGTPS